jgi:hypothetical protein
VATSADRRRHERGIPAVGSPLFSDRQGDFRHRYTHVFETRCAWYPRSPGTAPDHLTAGAKRKGEDDGLGNDAPDLGDDGVRGCARLGDVKRPDFIVVMSALERERYVRWWKEDSGLSPRELRDIANAVWLDHFERTSTDSATTHLPLSSRSATR